MSSRRRADDLILNPGKLSLWRAGKRDSQLTVAGLVYTPHANSDPCLALRGWAPRLKVLAVGASTLKINSEGIY